MLASGIFSYPVAQMQNIKGVRWSGPRTQNILSQWDHQEASSDGGTQIMLQRCKSWKSKVCFYVCVPWCALDVCRRLLNDTTVGLMHKCQIIICMEMATRNATNFSLFASPSVVTLEPAHQTWLRYGLRCHVWIHGCVCVFVPFQISYYINL